jgi:biotin operon repressor BirA-like protein
MQTETDLIRTLADGRFHSGEELGRLLGVSRAAVWKRLQQIRDAFGIEVDAVKGRGYRFREPLDLLDETDIRHHLAESGVESPGQLYLHASIDSTNSWLMAKGAAGEPSGAVCLAEQQLSGRGRRGRHWVSPYGRNIYLSLLWRFDMTPMQVAGLSLAAAVGVLRTLQAFDCQDAGLKWPNDILWQERKLAGLLLDPDTLVEVAHWTTPPGQPRRFATWFFVADANRCGGVRVDGVEAVDYRWLTPADALAAGRRHDITLIRPTIATLTELQDYPDVTSALAGFAGRTIQHHSPVA